MVVALSGFLVLLISGIPIVLALGIAGLIAIELTTGAPIVSARVFSSSAAWDRMMPPPTYSTGLRASAMSWAAAWICLP